jgi:hypothetical protein
VKVLRASVAVLLAAAAVAALAGAAHVLEGKGTQGWIRYWGNGTVTLSGRGTLTVKNESNLEVTLDGTWGEKKGLADGVVYTHFEGTVKAVGLGAHLEIRGWDLEIHAKGYGKAWFQGMGSTTLDGGPPREWPHEQTHQSWLKLSFRN